MKCPLRSISYKGEYDQDQYDDLNCLKEECAWWNKDRGVCSVKLGAGALYDLWYQLSRINSNSVKKGG